MDRALAVVDLTGEPDPATVAERHMRADLARPSDPVHEPVFVPVLYRRAADHRYWYVRCHHIAIDGYSFPLVCRRIAEVCTAITKGEAPGASPFAPLWLVVSRDLEYCGSPAQKRDAEFWRPDTRERPAGRHDERPQGEPVMDLHPAFDGAS